MAFFNRIVTLFQEEVTDYLPDSANTENIQSLLEGYQKISENLVESCQAISENVVENCQKVSENVAESCQRVSENVVESCQVVSENVVESCGIVTLFQDQVKDYLPDSTNTENIQSLLEGCQKISENLVETCQYVSENVAESCQKVSENVVENYQAVSETVVESCQKAYENVELAYENFTQAIIAQLTDDEISEISNEFEKHEMEFGLENMTEKMAEDFLDYGVKDEAQKALNTSSPFWSGVEWFLDWIRDKFKNLIQVHLSELPVVGKWASRIGTSISELVFTVFVTTVHFLKVVLTSPKMWQKANESATKTWNDNSDYGVLIQTYSYGKKMATFFLEIIKQCLERAIKAKGLEVSSDEKEDISGMLDNIL